VSLRFAERNREFSQGQQPPTYGLIFDLDNTLLRSAIDFSLMKREVCRLLRQACLTFDGSLPVSALIAAAAPPPQLAREIWQTVERIESCGMEAALLEPGVREALRLLWPAARLCLLTNNLLSAARRALAAFGIEDYFDLAAGRAEAGDEPQVLGALKPDPGGMLAICRAFPGVKKWLAVGDAVIDAQAAEAAGIGFVAYNNSRAEDWQAHWIKPLACLKTWDGQSVRLIEQILTQGG